MQFLIIASSRVDQMKLRMTFAVVAGVLAGHIAPVLAQDIKRFPPPKLEELTPDQKAYADDISGPPRNAKFGNPPYRAYIKNPPLAKLLSALSD